MDLTTFLIIATIKILIVIHLLQGAVAYTVWLERKVIGRIQNRWGPTRVGPFGLLQPIADGVKFILKEDLLPPYVNKSIYLLAPFLAVVFAFLPIAVIPFGTEITINGRVIPMEITDINIAVLFVLGMTSVGVYGIALAGWASNSKYSLLGSLRASAQMLSYELTLGLSIVGVLMLSETLSLRGIVEAQRGGFWNWNIIAGGQLLGFILFTIAAYAETNRIPFDLPEAETELVAGYHTEYSAMKFAMFFLAEYANMFTASCMATLLFLGGWDPIIPGLDRVGVPIIDAILPTLWFIAKVVFFIFLYIWVRGTLPRFRYDQLMALGWKVLLPLALVQVVISALWVGLVRM